jgi:hypothetical protein
MGLVARTLVCTALLIAVIKVGVLLADPRPAYFLGDSAVYLATTVEAIPLDRTFIYGLLIHETAYRAHSLQRVIWIQVVISALAAWLLTFVLLSVFRVRPWLAAAAGALCALEPLELLAERYILAESCANVLFALHLVLVLVYIRTGRVWPLLLAQALGVLLIGFRISFLPIVLVDSILPPFLRRWKCNEMSSRRNARQSSPMWLVAAHLVLSVCVSQGLISLYKQWYGSLVDREPALFYEPGPFLLSDFAPLIEPEDFPDASRRGSIFAAVRYDWRNLSTRPAQHFLDGGLWHNILKEFPDERTANALAIETATTAALRNPRGVFALAGRTFRQYWNWALLRERLLSDEGIYNKFDERTRRSLESDFGIPDPEEYGLTITKQWHVIARPWYLAILCSLVAWPILFVVSPRSHWPLLVVCGLSGLMFLTGAILFVDAPTPRFLTSAAWWTLLMLAISVNLLLKTRFTPLPASGSDHIPAAFPVPAAISFPDA